MDKFYIDVVSYSDKKDKLCQKSLFTFSSRRDISLVRRKAERFIL